MLEKANRPWLRWCEGVTDRATRRGKYITQPRLSLRTMRSTNRVVVLYFAFLAPCCVVLLLFAACCLRCCLFPGSCVLLFAACDAGCFLLLASWSVSAEFVWGKGVCCFFFLVGGVEADRAREPGFWGYCFRKESVINSSAADFPDIRYPWYHQISKSRCLIRDLRFQISDLRSQISGTRSHISDSRSPISDSGSRIPDFRCQISDFPDVRSLQVSSDLRFQIPESRSLQVSDSTSDSRFQMSSDFFRSLHISDSKSRTADSRSLQISSNLFRSLQISYSRYQNLDLRFLLDLTTTY